MKVGQVVRHIETGKEGVITNIEPPMPDWNALEEGEWYGIEVRLDNDCFVTCFKAEELVFVDDCDM